MSERDDSTRRTTVDADQNVVESPTREDGDDPNPDERGKWVSAGIAVVGLWLLVEPLLFDLVAARAWNDLVVGALLLATGGYNYYRQSNEADGSVGAASIVALLGLWLVATPFVYGVSVEQVPISGTAGFWNDVVVGLVTLVLGAYSAYTIYDRRSTGVTATA